MKQPLLLTAEQRMACARALLDRELTMTKADDRSIAWAIGLVRRAETYLAIVHAHAFVLWRIRRTGSRPTPFNRVSVKRPELHSEAVVLATQGHTLLLDFIKAAGWSRTAAQILADVAFGPDLNPEPAPASE